jgi:hypothetical protein
MSISPETQIPPVPVGEMPYTVQVVATAIIATLAAVALVASVIRWRRTGSPLATLLLLGAGLASLNEPVVDIMGGCMHYRDGQLAAFETYDRPIPAWVPVGYLVIFGVLPLLISSVLRKSAEPRKRFLLCVLAVWAVNLSIELPLLHSGLYEYYGQQPFKLLGLFPTHWLFVNELGVSIITVILYRFPEILAGRRVLGALVLPSAAQLGAVGAAAVPAFSLYNTQADSLYKWGASGLTMLLGVSCLYGMSTLLPRRGQPHEASLTDAEPAAAAAPVSA